MEALTSNKATSNQKAIHDAHTAMREAMEPVVVLRRHSVNELQIESISRLVQMAKHAHHVDLIVRINGEDRHFQADWLKHLEKP